jgi:hypothetical protein
MFEFAGIFTPASEEANSFSSPFPGLPAYDMVESEAGKVKGECYRIFSLENKKRPNLYTAEDLLVMIYGDCYDKIVPDKGATTGRLTAEEICNRYRRQGDQVVDTLKGSFVILLIDSNQKYLKAFTDPLNILSLYYRRTPSGALFFSSSLKALARSLQQSGIAPEIDHASLIEYYLFDFPLTDHTFLKDIREVPPGSRLKYDAREGLSLSAYFNPLNFFSLSSELLSREEGAERIKRVLSENIQARLESPSQTAVALTGGYDSRSIVALLGEQFREYQYFSYGSRHSWDVRIPQAIAAQNDLKYSFIDLEGAFLTDFEKYADQTIQMGDGIAEASRANYTFVYSRYFSDKSSILTGLFGSELIKTPSSRGMFIDENIIQLLESYDPARTMDRLFDEAAATGLLEKEYLRNWQEKVTERVLSNHIFTLDRPINHKYFYFLLLTGMRKYFSKEIKIEKPFVQNLTPFFDLDFIAVLLQTPFPWVYNWSKEKSLTKNLKIHQIYSDLIKANEGLLDVISTHGFRPRFLTKKIFYPLIAAEFFLNKKKIARQSSLNFQVQIDRFFDANDKTSCLPQVNKSKLFENRKDHYKDFIKLNSLAYWVDSLNHTVSEKSK